jgi:ribonuclease BN (tRNA processing enzyme)
MTVNSLSLYPLGVGDFGATRLFHISLLLHIDGRPIVIDCPHRFDAMLAHNSEIGEIVVGLPEYREIILTHLHIDHAGGLVELIESGTLAAAPPVTLYAPAPMLDYLWSEQRARGVVSAASIRGGRATLDRHFTPVALEAPHDFGSFALTYWHTQHIPHTYAYRFDFGNCALGYSGDTAYDPELIAWLDACDLVLHDVTWPPWWDDVEMPKLHAPLANLLELPEAFQRKTLLCHYDEKTFEEQLIGAFTFLEQNRLYRLVG